ncbi:hypothetical protein CDD81_1596 [Ophiocordyceps australis]|uniref:uracil phosphoribosyltransferase n=1 Tax=Ophiocordyceps australis TaxID=1399860 RepID=A0A2C5XYK2_9HYPO|nr:hypothetical protein CDD81_1596 [Ophiocordyceps australis]
MSSLPPNVHVSKHPCLRAKLSQLRSQNASPEDVKRLVHEISLVVACEAFAHTLTTVESRKDTTPLGFEYTVMDTSPSTMCIVPILRSGLAMVDATQALLPRHVPIHHLGMYRDRTTLDPVEYYNNLPSKASAPTSSLAIVVDPIIATGGTAAAAIGTIREWGAEKVVVLTILAAEEGLKRVAQEWAEATDIWVAGVDEQTTADGMLQPGLGDIGDRLFLTVGK